MRLLILAAAILMSIRLASASPSAQKDLTNLSLEELLNVDVINASRFGQKANQAPTSVSIITANDIRTFGWRTLADALNSMRGLFTANDRNYTYLGVRGFNRNDFNSHVLMMIDGQRMNENIFDTGNIGQEFMLDMDLVERIEFVPGSGSTIYGANAFFGLINVVTKSGKAIDGAQMAGEISSFDTYKGRASYGKHLENGADILVSASHFDSAGVPDLYFAAHDQPETHNGVAQHLDTERADRLFGRFQFEGFTLSGGFVDRLKRVPTAAYPESGMIFNDPGSRTFDRQFFANLKYETALSADTTVLLKSFYQGYDYNAEDAYSVDTSRVINHDMSVGRWWGGEAQLTTTAFERQRLIMGLEFQYDQRQLQKNYDVDPYALYQLSNRHGDRIELFVQDDIQVTDDLVFSAGLRFDRHHMLKRLQLNPRLGLIWNPISSTTFKLLYSSTFRAPHAWDIDYNNYYNGISTDVREELIKSYESIVEWHSSDGLKLLGSLFFNDISQFLVADPLNPGFLANVGKYHAYGAEWEAEKRWKNGRLVKASHTYSLVTNEANQGIWAYGSPQHIFKLHFVEPLFDGLVKLGVENIYVGDRKTWQDRIAKAYNLINLNLSSDRIAPGLDMSFGVYNVFDSHYQMLGLGVHDNLPMNGREFRLKLQLTF